VPCSCFPIKVSLQLSSEQPVDDVRATRPRLLRLLLSSSVIVPWRSATASTIRRRSVRSPTFLLAGWITILTDCKKGKGSPYSITERRVPELIKVLGSQFAGDVNHKPDGRLPLLSATPAVTPATLKRAATNFAAW